MQQNKLQELTNKLYKEGLSKGQQEAEEILLRAKMEAASIITAAKDEAAQIVADAKKTAEAAKSASDSEIRLATRQAMATVKQAIENSILTKIIAEPVKTVLSENEFLQKIILATIHKFDPQQLGEVKLSLLLPADMQEELHVFADNQLQKQLKQGVTVQFDKTFKAGFKIGIVGSGYHVSLTDNDFSALFCHYLRPKMCTILFGGK